MSTENKPRPTKPRLERFRGALRSLRARIGQRRRLFGALAALAMVVVIGALAVGRAPLRSLFDRIHHGKVSVAELRKEAKHDPRSVERWRLLGDTQFEAGRRAEALHSYDRALAIDSAAVDEKMLANLAVCFELKDEQPAAAALIVRRRVVAIAPRLEQLTSNRSYGVRWNAVATLEKLGQVSRSSYLHAWEGDLESPDCDVRRRATEKLGTLGDRRAIPALEHAKEKDHQSTPWYRFSCLGKRPDQAEKKILGQNGHKARTPKHRSRPAADPSL